MDRGPAWRWRGAVADRSRRVAARRAPRREPDHVRTRRPARVERPRRTLVAASRAKRCGPTPTGCGARSTTITSTSSAPRSTPGASCARVLDAPRYRAMERVLRRALARGPHDDAPHRVDPGEPRRRESRTTDRTGCRDGGGDPGGTWPTTSARCSAHASRTRRSTRRANPPGSARPARGVARDRSRPHRFGAPRRPGRSRRLDALPPRRAGDDDPRRRRRQPRRPIARMPFGAVDRRRPRRSVGRRSTTSRYHAHHAVPAGPPARLARAPHDRRAPRRVVAGRGRGRDRAARRPEPPRPLRRSPPHRRATAGSAAARDALHDPALRARRARRASPRPARSARATRQPTTRRVAATAEYFDRFVARGRCPADDLLDDWSTARRHDRGASDVVTKARDRRRARRVAPPHPRAARPRSPTPTQRGRCPS